MQGSADKPVLIRPFQPSDQAACVKLYRDGLLGGSIADNDTGLDIDNIDRAYMHSPGSRFWVAEAPDGRVVGMIGVQNHDEGVGEIRRLRVHQDVRGMGVGTQLMETAIKFCVENNHLKVALDTYVDREPAIKLFETFHFRLDRARQLGGRDLLYFYLDIYGGDRRRHGA